MEDDLVEYFKKRLNLSDEEFERMMRRPAQELPRLSHLQVAFRETPPVLLRHGEANLVPMSFYIKYTSKIGVLMITVVDYGMGNLGSIVNMFKKIGVPTRITGDPGRRLHRPIRSCSPASAPSIRP